jgi:TonB family protein
MKSLFAILFIIALSYVLAPGVRAQNQQPSPETRRRVITRVAPQYPEAAKRLGLGGTVKVVALVGSNGDVKKVEPVGGSPILLQAAEIAVEKWKYAPGAESQESVELRFNP